jgi:hypothetical protein
MLATDAELDVRAGLAATLGGKLDQLADAFDIEADERIARVDALVHVGLRKRAASSRLTPRVVCVRSLVPNEKNVPSSAISPAISAARGSSIIVPTR